MHFCQCWKSALREHTTKWDFAQGAETEAKKETIKEQKDEAPDLAFSKLPLPVVFKMLEDEYAIVIVYDTDKVSGMEYSGRFKRSENPYTILRKITRQYNLKLRKEAGAYKIE